MKAIVDGKEMEIEEPDNMFKQIDGKWYAKVYNEKSIEELQQENKQLKSILTEIEEWLKEKFEAINTIKSMLGESAKVVNPNIDGLEIAYKEIQDKITELKEKYK